MDSDPEWNDLAWSQKDSQLYEENICKQTYADGKHIGEEKGIQAGFDAGFQKAYHDKILVLKEKFIAELKNQESVQKDQKLQN